MTGEHEVWKWTVPCVAGADCELKAKAKAIEKSAELNMAEDSMSKRVQVGISRINRSSQSRREEDR